jgi:hypothetical protein
MKKRYVFAIVAVNIFFAYSGTAHAGEDGYRPLGKSEIQQVVAILKHEKPKPRMDAVSDATSVHLRHDIESMATEEEVLNIINKSPKVGSYLQDVLKPRVADYETVVNESMTRTLPGVYQIKAKDLDQADFEHTLKAKFVVKVHPRKNVRPALDSDTRPE